MLSARAERRHRDGKVPPRIAAVQKKESRHEGASGLGRNSRDDISMAKNPDRVPSPMETTLDGDYCDYAAISQELPAAFEHDNETFPVATVEPATSSFDTSVDNARAAVWTEWRPQRENRTVSDDEQEDNTQDSGHDSADSDDELVGLVMPEDDEDSHDSEHDSQSVNDRIEAEWEKEWAEMGVLYFLC